MKKRLLSLGAALALTLALAAPAGAYDMAAAGQYVTVSAGRKHTAAIKADGSLWTWGFSPDGALGDGTGMTRLSPVKIMDDVVSVSAGEGFTAAIKSDGSLWTWGVNVYGQLGDGTVTPRLSPVKVMDDVAAVYASFATTAAIKTDGSLWMWGSGGGGMFLKPVPDQDDEYRPGDYRSLSPIKVMDDVAAVSISQHRAAAIKTDGSLWSWGRDGLEGRQEGIWLNWYTFHTGGEHCNLHVPFKVADGVAAVSTGDDFTSFLKTDGSLWAWGSGDNGQMGNGYSDAPSPIKIRDGVAAISVKNGMTAALLTDGSLWTWGYNKDGRSGDGSTENHYEHTKTTDGVAAVSLGTWHTAVLKADGSLYACGSNGDGQLGDGSRTSSAVLIKVLDDVRLPGVAAPAAPAVPTVSPSPCAVVLDGKDISLNAYLFQENGGGANYVMLRDVARLLSGTPAQFEVGWTAQDGIILTTGKAYTPVGGELAGKGDGAKTYTPNQSAITVDGKTVSLSAYTIEGNNYFKLRDLGEALGFDVGWDGRVVIDTSKPYGGK